MYFAGSKDGPEGELAPNITPHKKQESEDGAKLISVIFYKLE